MVGDIYYISKSELEGITGGLSLEDFIESIDQTLFFILMNAHKLDMKAIKGHTWALYLLRKILIEMGERSKV